jgi:hypothetical protein
LEQKIDVLKVNQVEPLLFDLFFLVYQLAEFDESEYSWLAFSDIE